MLKLLNAALEHFTLSVSFQTGRSETEFSLFYEFPCPEPRTEGHSLPFSSLYLRAAAERLPPS